MKHETTVINHTKRKVLTKNSVQCLSCLTILESHHRHDFVSCNCSNQTFTDGGLVYNRVGGKDLDLIKNLCEYIEITESEHIEYQKKKQLEANMELQSRVNLGEMVNTGTVENPNQVSKAVFEIIVGKYGEL